MVHFLMLLVGCREQAYTVLCSCYCVAVPLRKQTAYEV